MVAELIPRILHLIPVDGVGGVEVAAKSMLARKDLPCKFQLRFIEPTLSNKRTANNIARVATANWGALWAARSFNPDVIICSLWRSVPLAIILRLLCRPAKLVYFMHLPSTVHRLDAMMSALALRAADEIWGDSAATLEARNVPSDRSRVISFVTDHIDLTAKTFVGAKFVSWGRLHSQKGFDRAIRLIGILAEQGIEASYDIYGPDGGARATLLELIRQLGLQKSVRILEAVAHDGIASLAAQYSFFLQPSRAEGMCMAAVEAMQLGLVPIVTPVGQMAHYVVPGKSGVFIDPERMDQAAVSIAALIADPGQWRQRSKAATRHWLDAPLYADDVCHAATELAASDKARS